MDFGALPPEINSGRMYAGPGSGSMLAAAAAWDGLAAQLHSAAASYSSVISGLTAGWQGPSSTAMAAAAAPYAAWMSATAEQAEQTATQARAAGAAYETAFAATVPPPVVSANRATLASLVATNVFGQNLSAIAATEAQYADMWAQDAAAMYGYAGQSAAAAQVTPFTSPPQTTDPNGSAAQSAAVAGTSTGAGAQSALSQLTSSVPSSLQSLASPAAAPAQADPISSALSLFLRDVVNPFGSLSPIEKGAEFYELPATAALPARNALVSSTLGYSLATRGFSTGELPVPLIPGVPLPPVAAPAAAVSAVSAVSADLGGGGLVGALSVPPSWASATPAIRLAASVLQGTGAAAVPAVAAEGGGSLLGEIALASLAGGAVGGTASRALTGSVGRAAEFSKASREDSSDDGKDSTADKDSKKADKDSNKADKLKRVLAELSQKPESVQHWHTDKAHLEGLLEQLTMKPGVHAVHVSSRHKANPMPPKPRWG